MIADSILVAVVLGGFLCCSNGQGYDIFEDRGATLFDVQRGKWRGRLGAYGGYRPPWVGLSTNVRYDHTKNLFFEGTGWMDTRGDYGVGVGVGFRFKRRAIGLPEDRFHLRIEASPCQFMVYDRNADGGITREEVRDVFPDEKLAEKLFRDFDSTAGDNIITQEEFYFMAPKLIYGCGTGVLNGAAEPVPMEYQQADDSVTAEPSDGKTDETSDDHTEE